MDCIRFFLKRPPSRAHEVDKGEHKQARRRGFSCPQTSPSDTSMDHGMNRRVKSASLLRWGGRAHVYPVENSIQTVSVRGRNGLDAVRLEGHEVSYPRPRDGATPDSVSPPPTHASSRRGAF